MQSHYHLGPICRENDGPVAMFLHFFITDGTLDGIARDISEAEVFLQDISSFIKLSVNDIDAMKRIHLIIHFKATIVALHYSIFFCIATYYLCIFSPCEHDRVFQTSLEQQDKRRPVCT